MFDRVLNTKYASGSEYARVLDMLGLHRVLKMAEQAWFCQNMPELWLRAWTKYMIMPKSAWMVFVFHFPIVIPYLFERVITYFNVYTKL